MGKRVKKVLQQHRITITIMRLCDYHYVILIEIWVFAVQMVNANCYPLSILLIHKVFPLLPEQHLDGHQLWRNQEASI